MLTRTTKAVLLALALVPAAAADEDPFASIATYDRAEWDRTATECDLIGAHPSDPERVGEGVDRPDMDLPAVIEACTAAVEADPANPRLNYQLARAYGYSNLHEQGDAYRVAALEAGYPQSLFVVGYINVIGWDGRGANPCYGGELIRRSAEAGRYAGLVGFPHYALSGRFDACEDYPVLDADEMRGFLTIAGEQATDFYQGLLVENLTAGLEAWAAEAR